MAQFVYKARDNAGGLQTGVMEAASEADAISALQSQDLLITSLSLKKEKGLAPEARRKFGHNRVTLDDLTLLARQLATLLDAGVTLLRALDVLTRQIESKRLCEVIERVKSDIAGGASLRDALAKHPNVFSQFWVNLAATGETSGHLPTALSQLANYLEASGALKKKVTSAMIYPCLLCAVTVLALFIFVIRIVPVFAGIYASFEVELPVLTRVIMAFSDIARKYALFLIIFLFCSGYLFRIYRRTKAGRRQFDFLKFRLPVFGPLFRVISAERVTSGLSTLIGSGVPILQALDVVSKISGNKIMEEALQAVRSNVRDGKAMAQPMEESGLFAPLVTQMVRIGEEIGELSKMLKRVAIFYQEFIAMVVGRMLTLFEPAILVFMAIVIGTLVAAMFLPIFNLATIVRA